MEVITISYKKKSEFYILENKSDLIHKDLPLKEILIKRKQNYISIRFKLKNIKWKYKYPKIIFRKLNRSEYIWCGKFPSSNDLVILIYDDKVVNSCILYILEEQWVLRNIILTNDILLDSFL